MPDRRSDFLSFAESPPSILDAMAHLILLEDEPILLHELAGYLVEQGHTVDAVGTAAEFQAKFSPPKHLIALVDLALPDADGIDLIDSLRGQGRRLGIVVISARSRTGDRVRGLAVGADYYLTKPIELEELSAVVAALSRRLETGGVSLRWVLDATRGELIPPGKAPVPLTAHGTVVLAAIARGGGEPVDRRRIVAALGEDFLQYDQRRLDTQVHQLRKAVLDASGVELPLRAIRNCGYRFLADVELKT
jgi:DNA-binding response OmpR family regulator